MVAQALFLWGALICLAGIAAACFIKEIPLRGKPTAAPAAHKATAVQAS